MVPGKDGAPDRVQRVLFLEVLMSTDRNGSVILMVEDDENDILLLRRALKKEGVTLPIQVATDGLAAIQYLEGKGEYSDREKYPLPCLVLLDLKLPRKNGLEVLSWVRGREDLKDLPVFMLSSSGEDKDRSEAERHGVEVYRVKPVSLEELLKVAREIRVEAKEHCGSAEACPDPAAGTGHPI